MINRIFIIFNDAYPYGMASAKRTATYVKGFSEQGIQTHVIIPIAKENYGKTPKNSKSKGFHNGGTFEYITGRTVRSKHFIKRRINDFWGYFLTLIFIVKKIGQHDKIIVYRGGWFWYAAICIIAKLKHTKTFLELNEYPYVSAKTKIQKAKRFLAFHISFPLLNGFIAISETLSLVAEKYKSKKAQVLKVPIVVVPADYPTTKEGKNEQYIFHAGTLSQQKDGAVGMIKAFALASKYIPANIKFYLTGNFNQSADSALIKEIISTYNISHRVIFTGYLTNNELKAYMHNASLAIINKIDSIQNYYCFPTKLGEYLDAGIPVITTNVGEAVNYLKNNVNASIVEAGDPQLIADKIVELFKNNEKRLSIAQTGKALTTKEFNYLYQVKRIIHFMQTITE
jgi:glycosyltransferase involved in cell wall biosynthesis